MHDSSRAERARIRRIQRQEDALQREESAFQERHGCTRAEWQERWEEREQAAYKRKLAIAEKEIKVRVDILNTSLRARRLKESNCARLLLAWKEVTLRPGGVVFLKAKHQFVSSLTDVHNP